MCMLQCVAVCCSVLQCVAVCCRVTDAQVLFRIHMCHVSLNSTYIYVCCSALQCVAVCCNVTEATCVMYH